MENRKQNEQAKANDVHEIVSKNYSDIHARVKDVLKKLKLDDKIQMHEMSFRCAGDGDDDPLTHHDCHQQTLPDGRVITVCN